MAKDAQEKTPEQMRTASQSHPMEKALTERDPRHGSHVVNGTIYQGSVSNTRNAEHHRDRGSSGISAHSIRGTQVDGNSNVLNGSVTNGREQPSFRIHQMEGGSVKDSTLVNGDLTLAEFRRIFCDDR